MGHSEKLKGEIYDFHYSYNNFNAFCYISKKPDERITKAGERYVFFKIRLRSGKTTMSFACISFGSVARYIKEKAHFGIFAYVQGRITGIYKYPLYSKIEDGSPNIYKKRVIHLPLFTITDIRLFNSARKQNTNSDESVNFYPNYIVKDKSNRIYASERAGFVTENEDGTQEIAASNPKFNRAEFSSENVDFDSREESGSSNKEHFNFTNLEDDI